MPLVWKRFLAFACVALILAPVVWLFLRGEESTSTGSLGGSGRPQQRPDPIQQPRREPLDAATRAAGENALRRIREKWRLALESEERVKAAGGQWFECGHIPPGLFAKESKGDRAVLRLLSWGYPEVAEAWATPVALNPNSPRRERDGAIWTLGYLAEARAGSGNAALVHLCTDPEPGVRGLAQYFLSNTDRSGTHRDLFRALARQGEEEAIEATANWPDPETTAICREVLAKGKGLGDGSALYAARAAMARQNAFETDTWATLARNTILEQGMLYGTCHFWWSLRIAQERRAPWLAKTLRKRLDREYLEGLILLGPGRIEMRSDVADEIFLALAELGASLEDSELAYVRRFGYLCEPRQRLSEMLDERYFPK